MKISVKITLLIVIVVAGLIILTVLAHRSLTNMNYMFYQLSHRFMKNQNYALMIRTNINFIRNGSAMMFVDPASIPERVEKNSQAFDLIDLYLDSIKGNIENPTMIQLVSDFEEVFAEYAKLRKQFRDYMLAGKLEEGRILRITKLETAINNSLASIAKVIDCADEQSIEYCDVTSNEEQAKTDALMFNILAIITLITGVLAFIIIMDITKSLKQAVTAANSVANGDLDVNLTTTSKDETGILMHAFDLMIKSINNVITDTNNLSAAAIAGQLEVRADANKYKGAYKELIDGINKTLDAIIRPLNITAEYVDRISKGDIPPKITDIYNGEFNEIKNNLNGCINTVGLLLNEINQSIDEALHRNLQYRTDVNKFQGDYSKIVNSVNNLAEAFVASIKGLEQQKIILAEQNEKLEQQNEELEKLNVTKDKFFSIIAHDLKNPLTPLLSLSELLGDSYDDMDADQVKQITSIIYNSSKNIYRLLENLLEWSRSSQGEMTYEPIENNINEIIYDCVNNLRGQANVKNISIEIPDTLIKNDVMCDTNMIHTVIRNLVSNAIKFSFTDSTIKVSVTDYNMDSNYIQVSVKDSGVGISEDDINKLFRIDKKLTTEGTAQETGTGLGLILCKEFIDKHNCKIWAESEIGKGTTFSFTLPKIYRL